MHFQVLILTSLMTEKSKYHIGRHLAMLETIHEASLHLGPVPLESTMADALE